MSSLTALCWVNYFKFHWCCRCVACKLVYRTGGVGRQQFPLSNISATLIFDPFVYWYYVLSRDVWIPLHNYVTVFSSSPFGASDRQTNQSYILGQFFQVIMMERKTPVENWANILSHIMYRKKREKLVAVSSFKVFNEYVWFPKIHYKPQ